MILFTVIALVAFFSTLFQCIPMRGPWDKTIHAKCLAVSTITHINIAYGGMSAGNFLAPLTSFADNLDSSFGSNGPFLRYLTHDSPSKAPDHATKQDSHLHSLGIWSVVSDRRVCAKEAQGSIQLTIHSPAGFGVARTSAYHSEFKDPFCTSCFLC